eukprot:TRINITY_DN1710_c0_g1_i11.p2 TRINITY_DN1710_c0_g1~~TRINITY_DN1710_c0_g1_i11.p2  ORF type:complete len:367 (+),score=192.12 TRINITY_DN1710_c0_g1_i11:192-1292(+)
MKFITIAICTILIGSAFAAESEATMNKRKALMDSLSKLKSNSFGEHILKTIDLQIKTTGATDNAIGLLAQIKAELEEQRELEANDYNRDATELNNDIDELTAESQSALSEVAEANDRIGQIVSQLNDVEDELPRLEEEVERIRSQKQQLENLRQLDHQEFVRRIAENRQIVEVITQIINSLSEIALSGGTAMIEKEEILAKLHSTKYTEPLIALTDLSSTFDPQFLRNVIVRLEAIRDNIIDVVDQDKEDEEGAQLNFDNIHGQLEDLQDTFVNDWASATKQQRDLRNELTIEENRRDTNQAVYDAAESAKGNAETDLQQLTDEHDARQAHYEQELEVLGEALNILDANAPSLRNYDQMSRCQSQL